MKSNLPTVQQIYAAFLQGDIPAIIHHLDDQVTWEAWADNSAQKAGVPWLKAQKGKAGAMAFFQVVGTMKINDFQVLGIMEGGNQVAVELIIDAEVPSTGGHFRDEEMHLWTFNDEGKVTRLRHYTDTAKHMKAAGL